MAAKKKATKKTTKKKSTNSDLKIEVKNLDKVIKEADKKDFFQITLI